MQKTIFQILALVACANGYSQETRYISHTENGFHHSLLLPAGYEEVWWPESPWKSFRNEASAAFKSMNLQMKNFAVIVPRKALEDYSNGGQNPMRGNYAYISWYPKKRMPSESATMAAFAQYGNTSYDVRKAISSQENFDTYARKYLKNGSAINLGVFRRWESGYIYSLAVNLEMNFNGNVIKSLKILSMGYQQTSNGYYCVNYVTIQEYGPSFDTHLDRCVLIAKSIKNSIIK